MEYIKTLLQAYQVFQNVDIETLAVLETHASICCFQERELILGERKYSEYVYFILRGLVSIYKMNANGQKKVMFILGKGEFINEDIIEQLPSAVSAEIFEKAELLLIPKVIVEQIMQRDFMFRKFMYASLSMKVRRLYRQLKNTPNSIKMEKRLAAKLFKLAKDYGVKGNLGVEIQMDLSITYLADLLGSQRETISRAVKVLQNENLIKLDKKHFYILNIERLVKYFKTS